MSRKLFLCLVLALSPCVGFATATDFGGSTSPLPLTHTTQIPGDTLKPGDYSITVVDQLSDRIIMRIDSVTKKKHVLFLAVPGSAANLGSSQGAALWATGLNKTPTLRGFTFANGSKVEFVYVKSEAAALAKDNSAKVLAVDPQSEGRSQLKNLSKDEMQMINLWMLSLTTTGVDNKTPAVLAQRYENRVPEQPVVASSTRPAAPVQVASTETETNVAPSVAGGGTPSKATRRKAVIAQLPHTSSLLPLVWALGLFSFGAAVVLRFGRVWLTRRAI